MAEKFDWRTYELVRKQLDRAREDWTYLPNSPSVWPIDTQVDSGAFESPIEVVFAIWWRFMRVFATSPRQQVRIIGQRTVVVGGETFRLDFVVLPIDPLLAAAGERLGCPMRIAVELDGHDFHERTKEQVHRRDYRDRVLQANGWMVMHISGSELVRTEVEAIKPIFDAGMAALQRIREALAKDWGVALTYDQ